MAFMTQCDACDKIAEGDMMHTLVVNESTFHFCTWTCLSKASTHMAVNTEEYQPSFGFVVEDEDDDEDDEVDIQVEVEPEPPRAKLKVKKSQPESSQHGPIKLHSTPSDQRREPTDDVPYGGVRRR